MNSFQKNIQLGLYSPVYLFYGDEPLLIEECLTLLAEKVVGDNQWNYELLEGESCSPLKAREAALQMPFFGRRLVVVRNIPWLTKKKNQDEEKDASDLEAILNYLEKPNESCILVLTVKGSIEKRRKLVKAVDKLGSLVECNSYKGEELFIWIKREAAGNGYDIPRKACELLTLACGNNMAFLRMEINKVCAYCGENKKISLADVKEVVSRSVMISIFELMDAVAARNVEKSIRLFKQMTKDGEPEQKILAMLGKQFRDMLGVKEYALQGLTYKEIAKKLDLNPYVAGKYIKSSNRFSHEELIHFLEILLNVDIINKSGEGDLHNLLETGIMQICGGSH